MSVLPYLLLQRQRGPGSSSSFELDAQRSANASAEAALVSHRQELVQLYKSSSFSFVTNISFFPASRTRCRNDKSYIIVKSSCLHGKGIEKVELDLSLALSPGSTEKFHLNIKESNFYCAGG